ncbi:MAG: hypothetical protein M1588_02975, partial [Planctomycetes bacterium]|nr:hypothetical protein [Planctomycetota bacterium]
MAAGVLDEAQRAALEEQYQRLNPVALRQQIDAVQKELWKLAERPPVIAVPKGVLHNCARLCSHCGKEREQYAGAADLPYNVDTNVGGRGSGAGGG